jgi:hypothetical protein
LKEIQSRIGGLINIDLKSGISNFKLPAFSGNLRLSAKIGGFFSSVFPGVPGG